MLKFAIQANVAQTADKLLAMSSDNLPFKKKMSSDNFIWIRSFKLSMNENPFVTVSLEFLFLLPNQSHVTSLMAWFCFQVNYCYILKQLDHDHGKTGVQFSFSSPL